MAAQPVLHRPQRCRKVRPGRYDIFFGFSQISVQGHLPSEAQMWDNLLSQVQLADRLGFETAWVGGAHFSLAEHQRTADAPTLPHFQGEVCLNTDIVQLATALYAATSRIGVGSAIQSIFTNGGPIVQAEALRTFLTLKALGPWKHRRLNFGFGTGRFDFVLEAHGMAPRTEAERLVWPVVKRRAFLEATELFLRLLKGEALASSDLSAQTLTEADLPDVGTWQHFRDLTGQAGSAVKLDHWWNFDHLQLIPRDVDLVTLDLYAGTTDPAVLRVANSIMPCKVFNLSNTPEQVITTTHEMMREVYHPAGGAWRRNSMPRTVLVFVNADAGKSDAARRKKAEAAALDAMSAWQRAMEGTVNPAKLRDGMSNCIFGCPSDVARQIRERYDPDDRLMLWFDFNNHKTDEVEQMMTDFVAHVVPLLEAKEP